MSKKEELEEVLEEYQKSDVEITESNKDEFIAKLNSDLSDQKKKTDEYFEHLKRNMAEFDNFKKRIHKEKDNMYNTITSDLLSDLIPIMDNFEKAMQTECKDESFKSGIEMIYTQINDSLVKLGLEEVDTKDIEFDPNLHEAVMHIQDENFGEKQIVEVFRKGYKLGDKVIRHSMVKVAN